MIRQFHCPICIVVFVYFAQKPSPFSSLTVIYVFGGSGMSYLRYSYSP